MDNIQNIYPLSPMQKGMLFHSLFAPETEVYTEQMSCRFEGKLNVTAFQSAWQQVVNRHDILRSAFVWEDLEEPLQVVHTEAELPFEFHDWRQIPVQQQKNDIADFSARQRKKGFNFTDAPLMRIFVIQLTDESFHFLWLHHHLLFDGWSLPVIFKEVFLLYDAFDKGNEIRLPLPRPYGEYISWLQEQDMDAAKLFWQERMRGFYTPTPLAFASKSGRDSGYAMNSLGFSTEFSKTLDNLAKESKLTVNTIIQGVWAVLLRYYSGEDDVVFGATVSGRPPQLSGVETMVGLFINTLPVRTFVDKNAELLDWLTEFQSRQAAIHQYEYTPLYEIQGWSDVPRDMPLFESLFIFENYPVDDTLQQGESSFSIADVQSVERTNYPLTLVAAFGKQLGIKIAYETGRFEKSTIEMLLSHFDSILRQFVENPQINLAALSILSDEEKQLILSDWNKTERSYPDQTTIHQWFEAEVQKHPEAVAVAFLGEQVSYADLNARANRFARYLRGKGVKAETLVGISLNRSVEMIVAVLAVLKAGGAYVPLDPAYPQDRLDYMVSDSNIGILITRSNYSGKFKKTRTPLILIDTAGDAIAKEKETDLPNFTLPENLAYVIYTSGSTGKPKGVLLHHRGACNFFNAMIHDFQVTTESRVIQFSSFSFDASVAETFLGLLSGAVLHLIEKDTLLDTENFVQYLNTNEITTAIFPPSLLTLLPEDRVNKFKTIVSVGDKCSWDLAARWAHKCTFLNGYGPTEITIGAIWGQVSQLAGNTVTPPIGKPIDNVKIYLLDKNHNPVPVGIPGEIYIAGVGVARGYLNRPGLTAERFIPDPFSSTPGARFYRTGDTGRFLPDGQIEFIGRIDFQVKLRGFRIELGEIEAVLKQMSAVKDAIVLAQEDTQYEKRLTAYIISDAEGGNVEDIRSAMQTRLPDYMVPAAFVVLPEFPLSPNGKVNRKALPHAAGKEMVFEEKFIPSATPEEELIATIWSDVLKLDKVGRNGNFFQMGGHSLLATQAISRLRDAFQVDVRLRDLFENPTVAELAHVIETLKMQNSGLDVPPLEPVPREGELPLSFAQQRLWFLDQLEPGGTSYNIPSALRISGPLDLSVLEKSIGEIVRRHESLRTIFPSQKGKPLQVIVDETEFHLDTFDLRQLADAEKEKETKKLLQKEFVTAFDLAAGPLFRVRLFKLADEEHIVVINMHHIISDGWSMGIFVSEILTLYQTFLDDKLSPLPELEIQYADFAAWQRKWLAGEVLQKQVDYWKQKLSGSPLLLELPADKPRPPVQTFNGAVENFSLPQEISRSVLKISQQENVTPFMVLLAGFQTLLHRYSGQNEILVGSPVANRTQARLEKIIGFFVNTLVLKADFSNKPNFRELLRQVRETSLGAYAHQDLPFEKLVEELQPSRDLSHSPLFQVAFILQNAPTQIDFKLPELKFKSLAPENSTAKYDLTLTMVDAGDTFAGSLEYNTDLFNPDTIRRMIDHFQLLFSSLLEQPDLDVTGSTLLSEQEKQKILVEWNKSAKEFPENQCVHQRFETIAAAQPDALAVSFKKDVDATEATLNYDELNKRANRLARYLRKMEVGTEKMVGVSMHRSVEMVVSMLAILKAGGAYVPIDPNYPEDRIEYMVQDSGLSVILTDAITGENLSSLSVNTLAVDSQWAEISEESDENLNIEIDPDNLAYLIYTSGSTGKPKGTMLRHRGALNLAAAQIENFAVQEGSRILQFSSLSFDAATWEFLMALLSGAALILTSRETIASGHELVKFMAAQKVTIATIPPSVLSVWPKAELPELQTLITAGEAVSAELMTVWRPGRKFFNAYGPTETTVCCAMHLCTQDYDKGPPIGRPIANFELYVLDSHLQPLPVGVPGELCVGGVGLARGYFKRPELTAEKFVPNPFSAVEGARLYRTGDLVRYLPDGNIEYLGRIDSQVKIRGFRIELGEIEALLGQHQQVKDVVLLARDDGSGEKRLVAYLVGKSGDLSAVEMKEYLQNKIPDYMVPAAFVFLDAMPLTPNGKIDKNALPVPSLSREELGVEFIAPRNEIEKKLVDIIVDLLKIKEVSVLDNFFDLGGHSLLATQFISRILEAFGVEIPLRILFEKPLIADFALEIELAIKRDGKSAQPAIKRVARDARRVKRSELS